MAPDTDPDLATRHAPAHHYCQGPGHTLGQELLRHHGVKPGEQIEVSPLPGGRIEVRAAQTVGSIDGFIGLLAGRSSKTASLEEIQRAVEGGWAGEP